MAIHNKRRPQNIAGNFYVDSHTTFPILIEENVYHCGYHAEASFAAASYKHLSQKQFFSDLH